MTSEGSISPIGSILIPAHNEARVLGRCLESLLQDAPDGLFEVIVIANGCVDETASAARSFAARGVRCVEIATASKVAAIRAGEAASCVLPRMYLDADVRINSAAAVKAFEVLREGRALAVSPRLRLDTGASSLPARLYLDTWQRLPVFEDHYVGVGCYALSEQARSRFGEFPAVVNDDQYINQLFTSEEKRTLQEHSVLVTAPTTLRQVVKRSLRVRAGRRATALALGATAGLPTRTLTFLLAEARVPRRWLSLGVFVGTQACILIGGRLRRALGRDSVWLRDNSSRDVLGKAV